MSRMDAIRNLAKSGAATGLAGAAAGAITGGVGADYSGGSVLGGMTTGAMMGAGAGLGSRLGSRGVGALSGMGMSKLPKGKSFLGLSAANRGRVTRARGMMGGTGLARGAGMAAGAAGAGLGYSVMNSNQGLNVTHRNATLNQKLQYRRSLAMQNSAVRINETRMKKQIWQPGSY